jgi:hypothetical protein
MSSTLTLIIHGTFANEAQWWQLGGDSFADRLERELESRGEAGTVWQPVLDAGMTYKEFSWTGENTHTARVDGARKLAKNLDELAGRLGNTAKDPLSVRLVGHSHGGNVVLESLGRLSQRVAPKKVVLLGTPLLRVMPAWRTGRLLLGGLLTGLTFLAATLAPVALVALLIVGAVPELRGHLPVVLLGFAALPAVPLFASAIFGILSIAMDAAWWLVAWPIWGVRGRWRFQAYGPSPRKVVERLEGARVTAFNSPMDEAGLGLTICSAPHRLVSRKLPSFIQGSFVEGLLLGPIVELPEIILERLAFGCTWWQLFFADFSVSEEPDRSYPEWAFRRPDKVTADLVAQRLEMAAHLEMTADRREAERIDHELGRIHSSVKQTRRDLEALRKGSGPWDLERRLKDVNDFIKDGIELRHSLYYENPRITARIADALTSAQ